MGKRSAVVEMFLGDMGSIQRELRPSTQREDQLAMETKLERIAVKAVNHCRRAWCGKSARHVLCESRGRATATGDPVPRMKVPRATRHSRGFTMPVDSDRKMGPV